MKILEVNRMNLTAIREEGNAILFSLRLMIEEDQKIAYAMLEGMRIQKALDAQKANKQEHMQGQRDRPV